VSKISTILNKMFGNVLNKDEQKKIKLALMINNSSALFNFISNIHISNVNNNSFKD
jgi:hypothetical protein